MSPSGDHREGSCRGRVPPLRRCWTGPFRIIQVTSGHTWWLKICGGANMGQQRGHWDVGSTNYWEGFFSGLKIQKRRIYSAVWVQLHVTVSYCQGAELCWICRLYMQLSYLCQRLDTKKVCRQGELRIVLLSMSALYLSHSAKYETNYN